MTRLKLKHPLDLMAMLLESARKKYVADKNGAKVYEIDQKMDEISAEIAKDNPIIQEEETIGYAIGINLMTGEVVETEGTLSDLLDEIFGLHREGPQQNAPSTRTRQ